MAETGVHGDVLVLLAALVVFVPLFHRLRVGTVLVYLVARYLSGLFDPDFLDAARAPGG